ncbi:protein PIN-LIKES 7-like [Cucurbita moschata]|uniref:Protein PIN-LIKES 7-like n=1 Tax=Cucurbita moschata TaxID=3662 RepID=A0A6J1F046_CUCMO|nr:protein PIN-LIKES 7-like [Cucurbita moschata]
MGLLSLLEVASMPNIQVLLICLLGAFLSTDRCNILPPHARTSLNKIVFSVFTPCLMFANLSKTVTFQDIISWWFMPLNIGFTFFFGAVLGWMIVRILKPKPYLEGLIVASAATGNLGNLLLIIIPAICGEPGNPFGECEACTSRGLSYASFSMALGGFYIWTYCYHLVKTSSLKFNEGEEFGSEEVLKAPDQASNLTIRLLGEDNVVPSSLPSTKSLKEIESQDQAVPILEKEEKATIWAKTRHIFVGISKELMEPPTLGAIIGFIFGAVTWLRHLVVGESAPFRVVQDSVKLLGDGTIPSTTLILGANLTRGLRSYRVKPMEIVALIVVRYIALPAIGIAVVKAANALGFLPPDPMYQFVLMVQYTLPPAMSIGIMTQLFDVGQEECSVIMFWTYSAAALALAVWYAVFMWILSP